MIKDKQVTSDIISSENEILLLAEGKKRLQEEFNDAKDLMRKIREGEVKIAGSTYCFNNGVALKKKEKEIYPFLEKKCVRLNQ